MKIKIILNLISTLFLKKKIQPHPIEKKTNPFFSNVGKFNLTKNMDIYMNISLKFEIWRRKFLF